MEKLIWDLYEMVREILPPTQANTERLAKWAQAYKAEHASEAPALELPAQEELDPEHAAELEELENEGGPVRASRGTPPKKKK